MALDVQLWFAKDENNNIQTINEVNKEEKHEYHCPLCNSEVKPKMGSINQWHFAHVDKSKCSSESMYHFWIKNKLLQVGDKFIIESDKKREYICKEILVEESIKLNDGKEYKPDLTIVTDTNETIYFEMNYSNAKKLEDYLDIWIELGNIVVEIDVKTLINSKSGNLPIFKAKYYDGKCFNIKSNNIYYKIIGKYKEQLINTVDYEKHKKDLEKIDWLWQDIIKYKRHEIDIEYISCIIDSIENQEEKDLVNSILNKARCNDLNEDYLNYKATKIINILINQHPQFNNNLYKIRVGHVYTQHKVLKLDVIFEDIKEKTVSSYNVQEYSIENIISEISNNINKVIENYQYEKDMEIAKNNIYLTNTIKKINRELLEKDSNYNLYERFVCGCISLDYSCNRLLDIGIWRDKEIIYSANEDIIYNYLKQQIDVYMMQNIGFDNEDIMAITNVLDSVNTFYNKTKVKLHEIERHEITHNTRRKKYKYFNVINYYNYHVEYNRISSSCIKSSLKTRKNDEHRLQNINIDKNNDSLFILPCGIYKGNNQYKLDNKIITENMDLICKWNNVDCIELEKVLMLTVSKAIKIHKSSRRIQ